MQIEADRAAAGDEPEIVALVDRAVAGDPLAFGELYAHYADYVYGRAYRLLGHHHDAENITGDVFMKAWQSIARFEWQGCTFRSWLFRMTTNAVIDFRRRRRCTVPLEREDQDDDRAHVQVVNPNGERELTRLFDADELDGALRQITEIQRQVLEMRFLEDMDHEEIAACLARRQGAIRAVQMRGLLRMRELLARHVSHPATLLR